MKRVYWYRTLVYARQHFHDFTTIAIRRNVLNFCGADVEELFRLRHSMNAKMLAAGNTMKQLWLILFMILGCANSTGSDNDNDQSTIILEALRERPGVSFVNKTRNYYTSIADPLLFETIFPGTEISCGYILRFYLYILKWKVICFGRIRSFGFNLFCLFPPVWVFPRTVSSLPYSNYFIRISF